MPSRTKIILATLAVSATMIVVSAPAHAEITPASSPSELAAAMSSASAGVTIGSYVEVPGSGTPNGTADSLTTFPTDGPTFAIMTSGDVQLADDPNASGSSGADLSPSAARGAFDVSILKVDLIVPPGPNCLRVDFRFLSEEFPEFVGSGFNDGFVAELDTSDWLFDPETSTISAPSNFAFDSNGDVISINNSGVVSMTAEQASGTTYDGATPQLVAQTPIDAGAHSVYFSIFDSGDHAYDSAVLLDNLSLGTETEGGCEPGVVATVPGPPTINQALPGNTEVGLNWSAPDSDGGSPITNYTVYAAPCPTPVGPGPCPVLDVSAEPNAAPFVAGNPTTFSYVVSGLTNGTEYTFTVTASNNDGESEGPPSEPATATPSGSADTTTLGADGRGTVDTGLAGGANSSHPSCPTDPSSPECKNIVARYSLRDPKNAGAVIGLASVRDADTPGGPIACLEFEFTTNQVAASPDCETVAGKALLSTYPTNVATLVRPHFAFEQNDRTVTTDVIGAPCFQLVTNANGTPKLATNGDPICKRPDFPRVFGPGPIKTNMCPDGTGWKATKPCAYVYYKVERIDGYDLSPADCAVTWPNCTWGTLANPKARRPVKCNVGLTCGKEVIIGSTIVAGIKLASGQYAVRPWCTGSWDEGEPPPSNIKWLPCDLLVVWLNFVKSTSVHYNDVLWTDLEVNDPGGKRTG